MKWVNKMNFSSLKLCKKLSQINVTSYVSLTSITFLVYLAACITANMAIGINTTKYWVKVNHRVFNILGIVENILQKQTITQNVKPQKKIFLFPLLERKYLPKVLVYSRFIKSKTNWMNESDYMNSQTFYKIF